MRGIGRYPAVALLAASALVLGACSSSGTDSSASGSETIEVEDNFGTQTVTVPPTSVVATDNRTFETLDSWGIPLTAAAVALMPDTIGYVNDDSIVDIGNHNEPDLEAIVAADPDLVINGQRFQQYRSDIVSLVPDAAVVELDPREGEPFDQELKRQVTVLGQIFDRESEATELGDNLDEQIERARAAYDPSQTVLAINVSGGEIGYLAPGVGRTLGPVYDILDLTPAVQVDGATEDHQGDDISVEAIAASNPDWILVLDRDAPLAGEDSAPAAEVITGSQALANVTAVREGNIVYLPADTYTNEGIQTYTEFFGSFADALEGSQA
ncbi:siderophore ABC transporter substrate-binding protein [Millisia brevis]|uniref:siderophore ABC transporter substrate-binding protein n=1 Tax=Millisia brevis TaxID=264148 RepID=UPI0008377F38|nr:ABC transporter substrate-binding protein [Millisia brevis]